MTEENPYSLASFVDRFPILDRTSFHEKILEVLEVILGSISSGGKILICGNGGSASDADHFAAELLKGFRKKRALLEKDLPNLSVEIRNKLQKPIKVIPLTGFNALSTAVTNDIDANMVFAQLTYAFGAENDIFIGISTSGNAKNVCNAMQVANEIGMHSILLTGRTGGLAKQISKHSICVPEDETFKIQELHLPIYHYLAIQIEEFFFGKDWKAGN